MVGGGIAGLSAGWLLGRDHEVVLYEAHARPGLEAHGVEVDGRAADVPLRVFYEGYYPQLMSLYRAAGVRWVRADYSTTLCGPDGEAYYRYRNRRPGPGALWSFVSPRAWRGRGRRITRGLLRYYRLAPRDALDRAHAHETLGEYLERRGYSEEFTKWFLLPAFAGVGTCSYERVRAYPAQVLNDYMRRGFFLSGVLTARDGSGDVARRLRSRLAALRCDAPVASLRRTALGVEVRTRAGSTEVFDHAVVATQANQALRLLADPSEEERAVLSSFRYEASDVVMHRDPAVMPRRRADWAPVDFVVDPSRPRPMATIWTNAVHPNLRGLPDLFQTWNPIVEPDPARVLSRVTLERPSVTPDSLASLERLRALHRDPKRRLWFCGSYAAPGIPLLESGVRSSLSVAEALGVSAPWRPPTPAARGAP